MISRPHKLLHSLPRAFRQWGLSLLTTGAVAMAASSDAGGWSYGDIHRFPAEEARQGVATDGVFFYAITNRAIGKYRCDNGQRAGGWAAGDETPIIHLNAGITYQGRLYCAHSNYPGVPSLSSVEIWDSTTMQHVDTHSFGRTDGSLTWLDRRNGRWIACFVHYRKEGGEPGRDPTWTRLVEFDDEWRETGGWALPKDLMERVGPRGYSISGGAFGPGGSLFVTGHDDQYLYVLEIPTAGSVLKWVASIPITAHGQAFGWDPLKPGLLYTINREKHEVIVGAIHDPSNPAR